MARRCGWCGRFVAASAEPISGVDHYGQRLDQLLCADCGPGWRDLSALNAAHLERSGGAMTPQQIIDKLREAERNSRRTTHLPDNHIDIEDEVGPPPNSRARQVNQHPCINCGQPVTRFAGNWWHVHYAKKGEVCLHPSPAENTMVCGLCGEEKPVSRMSYDRLIVNGKDVAVCQVCSSLEPEEDR